MRLQRAQFPVSLVKALLVTESFRRSEGEPQVIRCARALANVLDHVPVFIEESDLLAGNFCSVPDGVELSCLWAPWSESELDALAREGFQLQEEQRAQIRELNEYWRSRSMTSRMTQLYDDERLWPYAQLGVVLPAFRSKEEGWGPGGMLGVGWGVRHEISQIIGVFQFDKVLNRGLGSLIAEARAELKQTRLFSSAAVEKVDLLTAIVIALEAVVRFAGRLSETADRMASREADPHRRAELMWMAQACRRVPAEPARSFREALQSLWITTLVILPSNVLSYGRLDQLLYPFYAADRARAEIEDDAVLELLQWLRIKDSQVLITAGQTHRSKYGGLSKWHNCVIGGQTRAGADATNPLSYLILRAAQQCPIPHPTLTLRVHRDTPDQLLDEALQVIATGVGLPALLSDESCIEFLTSEGVPLEDARDYAVAGCLGINVPGQSRTIAWPMFAAPLILEFAIYGGVDPRSGLQVGPVTPALVACSTYEEFRDAVYAQLTHFLELQAEFNNVTMRAYAERFPQTVETALAHGLIQSGRNILGHPLPFENGSALNPIGMINVADSLAAVKKLVFDDRSVTAQELTKALRESWAGEQGEVIRAQALAAPKFGNNDDYVDSIAADLFAFWADRATKLGTVYGGTFKPASISIGTSVWPGGGQTGATPDGRHKGEAFADESLAPMRGRDRHGLDAIFASALKIDQSRWQALALDLRFHPAALASPKQRRQLALRIRHYFARGGRHIQFNVVSNDILRDAQKHPEKYRGLTVRIGGCSALYTQLPQPVQNELIARTEFGTTETAPPP